MNATIFLVKESVTGGKSEIYYVPDALLRYAEKEKRAES